MKQPMMACCAMALTGALAACAVPGIGGLDPMGSMLNASMAQTTMNAQVNSANMQAAMAAGQANAGHPGDEKLSCDQLQTEIQTVMRDPQVVSAVATMGASAQQQQDKIKAAQAGMAAAAPAMTAVGIASSLIPGGGWLMQGAMQAQMASAVAGMGDTNKFSSTMATNMTAIMPQMMRGQRLVDLANGKKCAFMQGTGAPHS